MQASKSRQGLGSFLLGTTILLLVLVLMLALFHPLLSPPSQRPPASVHLQLPEAAAPTTDASPETVAGTTKSPAPVSIAQSTAVAAKTPAPGTSCQRAGWYAQLGAFFTPARAEKLARRAASVGQPVCIGKHPQKRLYRVLAGPPDADRTAARTVAEGFIRSKISPHAYPQYWSPTS